MEKQYHHFSASELGKVRPGFVKEGAKFHIYEHARNGRFTGRKTTITTTKTIERIVEDDDQNNTTEREKEETKRKKKNISKLETKSKKKSIQKRSRRCYGEEDEIEEYGEERQLPQYLQICTARPTIPTPHLPPKKRRRRNDYQQVDITDMDLEQEEKEKEEKQAEVEQDNQNLIQVDMNAEQQENQQVDVEQAKQGHQNLPQKRSFTRTPYRMRLRGRDPNMSMAEPKRKYQRKIQPKKT